ncbi:MAG: ABC transporter ATP-binding protein, partial [Pseudomonadota bacterium]
AMAIANDPDLLVADEPTTALDVTVQAQILDVLRDLQKSLGLTLVLITHDLGVVAGMADEVAVMYAGRIVERAKAEPLFAAPRHPYTEGLLASIPKMEGARQPLRAIAGTPPSVSERPQGCAFAPRCPIAEDVCRSARPALTEAGEGEAACHFADRATQRQTAPVLARVP